MAENNINAFCKICGSGYHVCNSCMSQKTFKPWRSVTDSIDHYKIYLAIHGYTISNNREKAKKELEECNLSGFDFFKAEIKDAIEDIIGDNKKTKVSSRKRKEYVEVENEISE